MQRILITDNIINIKLARRLDLNYSHHNYAMWEMLANITMAIILQYISVSNHNVVHPKLTQFYMSIISQKTRSHQSQDAEGNHVHAGGETIVLQGNWEEEQPYMG